MYNALLDRIDAVAQRFRTRRMWWMIAMVGFVIAFLAFCGVDSARNGRVDGISAATWLGVAGLVGCVVALVTSRNSYRNPRSIATKIEATHPSLNQRLLTALEQRESKSGEPLGYLQTTVIREARDHARKYDWSLALPSGKLWASRLIGFFAAALMAITLGTLAASKPATKANRIASIAPRRFGQCRCRTRQHRGRTRNESCSDRALLQRSARRSGLGPQVLVQRRNRDRAKAKDASKFE